VCAFAIPEQSVNDPVSALVLDLLEWVGSSGKPYADVMDAWRTSCPRLPVSETANELGLLDLVHLRGERVRVAVSSKGREYLAMQRDVVTHDRQGGRGAAVVA
jgi:hypothetical protein